jgi:hypothetical protein
MTKHNYRVNGKFAKKPVKQVDQPENHFCLVVDASGSMVCREKDVERFVNRWLDEIRENTNRFGQVSKVSLIEYSTYNNIVFCGLDINDVKTYKGYKVSSMTALFDAQAKAIDLLKSAKTSSNNVAYIVNHITDGEENSSTYFNRSNVPLDMAKLQQQGNWTFTFLLPPGHKDRFVRNYGLEAGNITEWENTQEGIYEAEEQTSAGLFSYMSSRSVGGQSVKNFYQPVQVDLSNINNLSQVAKQSGLTNLAANYNKMGVPRECDTKELVEKIFNISGGYYAGRVYYELSKPEKVQPTKDILVMEKGKSAIYGGKEARHLIGLPDNQYAKVDPFNLSKFKIFIRSDTSSGNRKLVRGTEVLIKK